jgi:DNA-3-methyladenine glycosylase II
MWLHTMTMAEIVDDLSSRDRNLAGVIASHPLCDLGVIPQTSSNFESLVDSVIAQQVSVKSASAIFGRLQALCGGHVSAESVATLDDDALRACGLSGSKTRTIRGLADASLSGAIDFEALHLLNDDHVVSTQLNALWGIGPWTVDMFMMNRLGKLDVWPVGDLGMRRGWEKIYQLAEQISPAALTEHGDAFRPYRTVVAWYCWRVWD